MLLSMIIGVRAVPEPCARGARGPVAAPALPGERQTSTGTAKLSLLPKLPGVQVQKWILDKGICPIPIGFENLTIL